MVFKQSPKCAGNLTQTYHKIVQKVVREMKRRNEIKAVVLSGSVGRGDFTPYSDIELNVIVDKEAEREFEDEDLWRSRNIGDVFVEVCYGSVESWEKRVLSQKEEPRCLNQFAEAKIQYDPNRVAEYLVNLAKKTRAQFRYPAQCMKLAAYAVRHNKNKILSDLYRGKELLAAIDADFATGWISRALAYRFNIPNTEWSGNLEQILASKHLTDEFKGTLIHAIKGSSNRRIKAAIHLSDLYLQLV